MSTIKKRRKKVKRWESEIFPKTTDRLLMQTITRKEDEDPTKEVKREKGLKAVVTHQTSKHASK